VADGEHHRPPYQAAASQLSYAVVNWAYLDGLALSGGTNLAELPLNRILNFAFWHMHETVGGKTEAEQRAAHERLNATMRWPTIDDTAREGSPSESAQTAMMGVVSGPPLYIDDTPETSLPPDTSDTPPWDTPA
jgi:hypothetical protein